MYLKFDCVTFIHSVWRFLFEFFKTTSIRKFETGIYRKYKHAQSQLKSKRYNRKKRVGT